ncbi:ferric reductase family protein [Aspergillus stella-maris]|uniref:ferric reductase family protein n=1 Tax=Aspergillus stella-maris TaxID=1810926 RepID=UPI003CCDB6C6
MDSLAVYAIAVGGIFVGLFFARKLSVYASWMLSVLASWANWTFSVLASWKGSASLFFSRHLALPFLVHRHRFLGPWSRADVLFHTSYATVNIFLVFYKSNSVTDAGHQAAKLALINIIFPLSTFHISHLADILGIKWRTCCRIHRVTGWTAVALLSFHVIVRVQVKGFTFPLGILQNLFTMLATVSLGVLVLIAIPWIRQWSYEIFLRGHQALAGLFVYGTWQHISQNQSIRTYVLIALGIFGVNLIVQLITLLYRNGLFTGRGAPRAIVTFSAREARVKVNDPKKEKEAVRHDGHDARLSPRDTVKAAHILLILPRPVKVEAGQYINLWMPSVSLWSWMQTHPFTVTSWSKCTQDTMELLVQPRHGLTAKLLRYAPSALYRSVSFLALFTGPHGTTENVSQHKSVIVIASRFGIAAAVPYLKKMIYGYNTGTSQVRRLQLVWQVESVDEMTPALALLNNLLKDDTMGEGYILHISIYVKDNFDHKKLLFGEHQRVYICQNTPDYSDIISLKAFGNHIERLPDTWDEEGRTLVIVSATDDVRDQLREVVRNHVHQDVKLSELEYQPSAD